VLIGGRLLLIIQRSRMAEIDSIWSNAANLAELANYIPTGLSLVGLAGLVWLGLSRRGPMRGGVLLVAFIGIFLLANRNLDAVHPWASRRWVPVLIPAVCAGVAFFVWRGLQIARSLGMLPGRGTVLALFWVCGVVIVGLVSRPSWPLVSSRSGRGLERAHESLAELIGPDAVVFAIPSTNVRRWLPWQLGRYGIAGYVLDSDTNAWSRMLPVFRDLVSRGKRVIYLTDDVPAKETTESGLLRLVGQRDLNWAMQDETLWSLPTLGPTEYSQRIYAYEVTTAGRSLRGWSPSRLEARGAKSPWAGEWPMFLGSDMLGSALVGFAGRASLAHRLGFEDAIWLGKRNRIYLDELLKAQSEQPEPGPKVIGYEVVLPMHSGPARGHGVKVQVLRDLSPTRTMDLVWAGVVGEEWTTVIVRLGADRLQAESALEIQSLRPPLGNEIPGGQVGALIGPIQIRPITIAR
jgi:hypothetical protein